MIPEAAQQRVDFLRKQIHYYDHKYYVLSESEINDFEYDQLLKELQQIEQTHPEIITPDSPTQRVGSDLIKSFDKVAHEIPMLSLDNTYNIEELESFETRNRTILDVNYEYVGELKVDGIAISLLYENGLLKQAITRGDGQTGNDVTANIKTIKSIPLRVYGKAPQRFMVRGEIYMTHQQFEKLNIEREKRGLELYANPRNTASGSLKLLDPKEVNNRNLQGFMYGLYADDLKLKTHFEMLQKLKNMGFRVSENNKKLAGVSEIKTYINQWETQKNTLEYDIDGVVVKVNDLRNQAELGFTNKSPRWAISYKFATERAETRLMSVDFQVGRTGAITPVANLEPTLLLGTTVKRASLHNQDQIDLLDLREHDTVVIEKGGEIIPKIVGIVASKRNGEAPKIVFPKVCPGCENPIVRPEGDANYYCVNQECLPIILGRFGHFVSKKAMDIDSLGEKTLTLLHEKKIITTISDIYRLKPQDFQGLEGFKEKAVNNIIEGVEASKKVPFERVLFALGIRHVGSTVAKTLAYYFKNIDALMGATFEQLNSVSDIGEKVAQSIITTVSQPSFQNLIQSLKSFGILFEIDDADAVSYDALKGLKIVITGSFEAFKREELKSILEKMGAKCPGSVSKNTSCVLSGESPGGSKIKKATDFQIPILSLPAFQEQYQLTIG